MPSSTAISTATGIAADTRTAMDFPAVCRAVRNIREEGVISRVVDEQGTTTTLRTLLGVTVTHYRPHETTLEVLQRVVEHVQHRSPRERPFPDDAWRSEIVTSASVDVKVTYGSGMGFELSFSPHPGREYLRYLPAAETSLDAAIELFNDVVNIAATFQQSVAS